MRVSLKWLLELVDVQLEVDELVERLDMTGTAVEAVHTLGADLDGIVIGRIVTKERHRNADTLWVTTVDIGAKEPLHIVCGAQNFEAGDIVPVATVGTTLPNGVKIKKAKLRGEVSEGMNCSPNELGLGDDHSGLMILPPDAPVGMSFSEYAGLSDTVLELEVTPNRPDCLSVAGVAREVGAITGATAEMPGSFPQESGQEPAEDAVRVTIEAPDLCPRYTARLIRGVTIGQSPEWLKARLVACGQRPVNNIVDITNYVMFELGQPLHAFDAAKVATAEDGRMHIVIRRAHEGETLTTLDGQDRKLTPDMLLITDPSGPIALAGVMGGAATEVSDTTADILLESACFDTSTTSRASRSLGLISEASLRFERGVDPNGCVSAVDRAAALMAQVCGGSVAAGVVDEYPQVIEPLHVTFRPSRLNEILGASVAAEEASEILARLGMGVSRADADLIDVVVPTFRPDVEREIDLIEEVVRVWGMDRVELTLPGGRQRIGRLTSQQRWRERIGATLRASGLNETMTYSFGDPRDMDRLGWPGFAHAQVRLLNPMSEEQSVMRPTLAAGLLRSVSYNQRRDVENVHLYEMGTVFSAEEGRHQPVERAMVAGVLAGRWHAPAWNDPREAKNASADDPDAGLRSLRLNFFDGKGVLESLFEDLGCVDWSVEAREYPWLQPGRSAKVLVNGTAAGWLGEVHPRVLDAFDAEGPVVLFELAVEALVDAAVGVRGFTDIPRFPAVELDIALVVDEAVTAEEVDHAIMGAGVKLLESARLFDVYRGTGVPEGKKSLAFELTYRAGDRTLTDDEVRPAHDKLLRKVTAAVGAELRS